MAQSELTQTNREYLAIIEQLLKKGYAPTAEEIAEARGVHVQVAHGAIRALESKGALERVKGKGRTMRLVKAAE